MAIDAGCWQLFHVSSETWKGSPNWMEGSFHEYFQGMGNNTIIIDENKTAASSVTFVH